MMAVIDALLHDPFVLTLVTRVLLVRLTLLHLEVESNALPQVRLLCQAWFGLLSPRFLGVSTAC